MFRAHYVYDQNEKAFRLIGVASMDDSKEATDLRYAIVGRWAGIKRTQEEVWSREFAPYTVESEDCTFAPFVEYEKPKTKRRKK